MWNTLNMAVMGMQDQKQYVVVGRPYAEGMAEAMTLVSVLTNTITGCKLVGRFNCDLIWVAF